MAVLQNMREKFGIAISVIIALSLLYFIAPMDDLMTLFGKPQNVGEIAGKAVSYEDFQDAVQKYTTINEIVTGSTVQNDQTNQQIRNAAWQEFIDKYLFIKNAKAAGINVGDDEMLDLTTGAGVSPMISGNPMFQDASGNFSLDALRQFISSLDSDQSGNARIYWNYLQQSIEDQAYYAKYGSLFGASYTLNKLQLQQTVDGNNTVSTIDYVVSNYPFERDTTIKVSSNEVKAYYDAHKKEFKRGASRDAEYVVFEVVPSADDIAVTNEAMASAYDEFCTTDNMKAFLLKNSERSYNDYWYKEGELSTINETLNNIIFGGEDVTPIIADGNSFYAARTMASEKRSEQVYVKHILLQGDNAEHVADSLANVVKNGGNFAALAAIYSVDKGSQDGGVLGNIGWLTQSRMIPGFESVLEAQVGKPFVLNTQYGSHVVLVSEKSEPVVMKKVAILEKTALASKETFNDWYSQANTFASLTAGTYEGFKKALDSTKVYSHPMTNVTEATSNYGAIDNAKEVTRWIFDNKKGKASGIITVNNNYFFIVTVKEVRKEGYTPVKEAAPMITDILYSKKMQDKYFAEVSAKIAGKTSLEEVSAVLDSPVETQGNVSFASMSMVVEPALTGAVSVAQQGKLAGPVKGQRGVYVFTVTGRETGSFYTDEDARNFASQMAQYSSQMILPVMEDAANVKDNRARYY